MSLNVIDKFQVTQMKAKVADVRPGETVKVHYKIREGGKERIQIFEGLVIGTKATKSYQGSFTVRKVVDSIGVERTFPFHSPWVTKVERVKSGKVRRAKLNFVREYAMSRRFKLKDTGLAGTTWEELEKQELGARDSGLDGKPVPSSQSPVPVNAQSPVPAEAESPVPATAELVKADEATDNGSDVISGQAIRGESGELGDAVSEGKEIPDSETKLPN